MLLLNDSAGTGQTTKGLLPPSAAVVIDRFLKRVFGRIRIIDFSFPGGGFSGVASDVLVGIAWHEDDAPGARAFFSRFRQAGGQMPILSLGRGALDPIIRESAGSSDGVTVLYLENGVTPDLIRSIAGISGVAILVGLDLTTESAWSGDALEDLHTVDLQVADMRDRVFRLVLPDGEFSGLDPVLGGRGAAKSAVKGAVKGVAGSARSVKGRSGDQRAPVVLDPADAPRVLSLAAARFIHDGGYKCEIDGGYSWLWSGPSPHLRLLVGGLTPTRAKRQLKLTIVNTNDPDNLEGIRIMIDGCIAPSTLEKWTATSGRVVVDVPASSADFTVLSIGCPQMSNIDVKRQVGFCVDGLEVHS